MDDKNPRVGGERLSGRGDDLVSGREGERTTDYTSGSATRTPVTSAETTRGYVASPATEAEPDIRTREIRREIEQTREEMSETVDAIQDRLNPRNIAANAADSVRTTASEKAREIADSEPVHYVRANPIPTAMVGIGVAGLAWLAFGGNQARESRRRAYERNTRDWRVGTGYYEGEEYYRATGATDRPRTAYESANVYSPGTSRDRYGIGRESRGESSWTSDVSARASDVAGDLSRRARLTTERTRNQLQRTWHENPLLVGAASAVIGAIVGLSVPETERENEWMGETRDNVVEGVQQAVREKVEEVQETATKAVEQVKNVVGIAADEQRDAGDPTAATTGRTRKRGGPGDAT